MIAKLSALAFVTLAVAVPTIAQAAEPRHGGVLKIYHRETPPSLSIHEEANPAGQRAGHAAVQQFGYLRPAQAAEQHRHITPELATSWEWSKDNLSLIFKLRQGVTWHDGKPFTAKDVKCTLDLLQGKAQDKFRKNPRKDCSTICRGHHQWRRRSHIPPEAAAALVARPARVRLFADVCLPRDSGANAHAPDRHRPIQICRVQTEQVDQAREKRRIIGKKACHIWTASSLPSFRTAQPRCLPSSPARST